MWHGMLSGLIMFLLLSVYEFLLGLGIDKTDFGQQIEMLTVFDKLNFCGFSQFQTEV